MCTLPEQLEFKNAKCTTALKYRVEGRELIFEPLPKLAKKVDVIYRIQVRGIAPGDVRFKTRIRADGLKEPVSREESMRIYSDDTPLQPTAPKERDSFGSPRPNVPAPIAPTPPVSRRGAGAGCAGSRCAAGFRAGAVYSSAGANDAGHVDADSWSGAGADRYSGAWSGADSAAAGFAARESIISVNRFCSKTTRPRLRFPERSRSRR